MGASWARTLMVQAASHAMHAQRTLLAVVALLAVEGAGTQCDHWVLQGEGPVYGMARMAAVRATQAVRVRVRGPAWASGAALPSGGLASPTCYGNYSYIYNIIIIQLTRNKKKIQ